MTEVETLQLSRKSHFASGTKDQPQSNRPITRESGRPSSRPGSTRSKNQNQYTGPKISFGTTLNRHLFPLECAPDRTGNELTPLRGSPNRGPGVYNDHEYTSFIYQHHPNVHPCSKTGYYLNRTEKRFFGVKKHVTPAPNLYQKDNTKLRTFKPEYKPFASDRMRFEQATIDPMITPGPGSYNVHNLRRDRKISWPQMFGGRTDSKARNLINPNEARRIYRTDRFARKAELKRENRLAYFKLYFDDE